MATYGNYETVGRIYSIGARSVYSAKAVGGAKDEFVIKVVAAEDVFGEDPAVVLREFTQRAKFQQQVGEAKSRAWAAVHEVGQRDGEVYYVTDRAASSVQQLVAGKVRTEGSDLYRVVASVIQGLRDLRAATQRAHANLKPSNVLIDRTGDVAAATIMLTDPSGADQPRPAESEHADVRDLGDLIHQMVLHAPFRAMGGYPIEESPGWARLGNHGERWRALCNRMLDPAAAPGSLTIESVAGEIESLKASGGGGKKPIVLIAAAAGLLLIAGAAVVVVPMLSKGNGGESGPVPVRFDAAAWSEWCAKAPWALALRDELSRRAADLERDEYLRTALLPLSTEQVELRPYAAVPGLQMRSADLARIREDAPDEVRGAAGAAATAKALDWIARVEAALSPTSWPAPRTLKSAEDRLAELGWDRFADYPRRIAGRLSNREDAGRLVSALLEVGRAAPALDRLLTAIDTANPGREDQVPIQARMYNLDDSLLGGVQPTHIEALTAYITDPANQIQAPVAIATNNTGGNNDPNGGNTTGQTPPDPVGSTTNGNNGTGITTEPPVTVDIGPDPRADWPVPDRLEAVRARLREAWVAELSGASAQGAAQAVHDVDAVSQVIARVAALEWNAETREDVRAGMTEAQSRLDLVGGVAERLHRDYEAQVATVAHSAAEAAARAEADHREFVREFETRTPTVLKSPYLALQWDFLRRQIVRQHEDPSQLAELRNAAAQLERAIALAESGVPMPALPESGPAGFDPAALSTYFTAEREGVLERVWQVGVQGAFGDDFQAVLVTQRGELTARADVARRAIAEMILVQTGLDAVAGWNEPLNRAEPPETLASLAGRWAQSPPPPEIVATLGPTPQRLAAVAQLVQALDGAAGASPADLGVLTQGVASDQTPLITRVYTWRALRAHPGVSLQAEDAMLTGLRTAIGGLASEARRTALLAELDQGALARWNAAIEAASTRAEYEAALAVRARFNGSIASVTPRTQFNLGLILNVQRLEQLGSAGSDDEIRAVLQLIVDAADARPELWQSNQGVRAWIDSARAALSQRGGANVDVLATRGPGSAGWSFQTLDPSGNRIRYTRSAGGESLALEFVRLDPGTDAVPQSVYLSTTEISLRQFGAAANAAGAWGRIETAWGDRLTNVDDSWEGPRVWSFSSGSPNRLGLNDRWLSVQGRGSFSIPRPFASAEEAKSLDMPVQHITAPAARVFAQANGCRLPTSQEWQGARRREGGGGWNLRDTAWAAQRDFAADRQARPPLWPFPDAGVFPTDDRKVNVEGSATAVAGATDGVLYFQAVDVGAGSTFRHIVGNVAEFVDDSPTGFSGSEDTRAYRVIGGSALSPPELAPDQALPLVLNPLDNYMVPTNTYSDVGFRLAFDAGQLGAGPPLAQQVGDLVQGLALIPAR